MSKSSWMLPENLNLIWYFNLHVALCYIFVCFLPCQSQSSVGTKASVQRSTLFIIHLLSSSCTSYFYNISYMFVPFVSAVWQYCQQHSECILSDPGPIIIVIFVFATFVNVYLFILWCNTFYCVLCMSSMPNHYVLIPLCFSCTLISGSIITGRSITCNHCM